ncbi:MAG: AAA family ATPase [Geobacteraceae bacterium GWC2_58_44]|nr:MAG: AAA family ATPase [Geobacteraceae bacterium GWC2_58_44]HBG06171.1 AAA family ATPase [Geobacter sp.]
MARADILLSIVKSAIANDSLSLRKAVEALATDERSKNHRILADRLVDLLSAQNNQINKASSSFIQNGTRDLVYEVIPEKRFSDLVLEHDVLEICREVVEEHHRADLLSSYGIAPRHRLLFAGPPGNGKTTLAEAIASELMYPLLVVRYENVIGSYLGETASRLQKVFETARTRKCVVFLDEFETLGKERGDTRETGEIKRVVSSLLLQIDRLPSHTVVITASNHPELLDRAVWRRFQVKVQLSAPTKEQVVQFIKGFEERTGFKFKMAYTTLADKLGGISFSEIEEFCTDVLRRCVLGHTQDNPKEMIKSRIKNLESRFALDK